MVGTTNEYINTEQLCGWQSYFDDFDFEILNNNDNDDNNNDNNDNNVESNVDSNVESNVESKKNISKSTSTVDTSNEDEEEYRIDPYDGNFYSKSEFNYYYVGLVEWEHMDPKMVLVREEYYKFSTKYQYMNFDKFVFLFNQFKATF